MKVLMGVDHSEFSGDLVRAIVKQFRSETTEVLVLHVLQQAGPAVPEMDAGYAPEMEGEGKWPTPWLIALRGATWCRLQGRHRRRGGRCEREYHRRCHEWGADLIVVGSHGQRGIRRFLLGSAAEFVARHASCSVEIVRRPKSI